MLARSQISLNSLLLLFSEFTTFVPFYLQEASDTINGSLLKFDRWCLTLDIKSVHKGLISSAVSDSVKIITFIHY